MDKQEKIYVGSGKTDKFNDVNYTLCLSDIPKEWIYEYKGKKYINISGKKKKETDQYGKTHYIQINTFKPDENKTKEVAQSDDYQDNDLPF